MKIIALALAAALAGCEIIPQNPTSDYRGEIARAYTTTALLAGQIGAAQKQGYISVEKEDELLDALESVIMATELAESAEPGSREAEEILRDVRDAMSEIKTELGSE